MTLKTIKDRLRQRTLPRFFLDLPLGVWFALCVLLVIPIWYVLGESEFHLNYSFEVLDSVLVAAILGVQIASFPASWRIMSKIPPEADMADAYLFSYAVQLLGLAVTIVGLWWWRFFDRPEKFEISFLWLLGRWIMALGFFYMLCVIWATRGVATRASIARAAVFIAIAACVGLISLTLAN